MWYRSRALALGLSAATLLGAAPPTETSQVTVTATGLRNDHGVLRACITGDARHFPRCSNAANSHQAVGPATKGSVTLTFTGVKPGRYAVALLHDENNNGKADRAAMMVPTEGFGFSRDAPVRFGPPKFDAAAFEVTATNQKALTIRMRYML